MNFIKIMKKLIELEIIKELIFKDKQLKLRKIIYNRRIKKTIDPRIFFNQFETKKYFRQIEVTWTLKCNVTRSSSD